MHVNPQMTRVQGRILHPPKLAYRDGRPVRFLALTRSQRCLAAVKESLCDSLHCLVLGPH